MKQPWTLTGEEVVLPKPIELSLETDDPDAVYRWCSETMKSSVTNIVAVEKDEGVYQVTLTVTDIKDAALIRLFWSDARKE